MTALNQIFGIKGQYPKNGSLRVRQLSPQILALLLLIFSMNACSLFGDKKTTPREGEITEEMLDQAAAEKAAKEEQLASATTNTPVESPGARESEPRLSTAAVVELIWKVPGGAVEKYHLAYGYTEDEITTEIILKVDDLEKMDHPEFGPVYRYILSGVPSGKDVYFTLQAENKFGISEKTPPQAAKQE